MHQMSMELNFVSENQEMLLFQNFGIEILD